MVYAVYFSPTETSKKNAVAVAGGICGDFCEIDLTVLSKKAELKCGKDDVVVFSFPVYGGRILPEALDVMKNFVGDNTPCVCLVTYGNRAYDFALAELCTVVKNLGFIPFAGGALIGQHTYGEIAVGRPNVEDLRQTAEFAKGLKEKISSGDIREMVEFTSFESETKGKGGRFYPLTNKNCVKCGVCERNCPMGAILKPDFTVNSEKCIACFRCIQKCPKSAKNMNEENYIAFAKDFSAKLSGWVENQYFC